MSKSKGNFFTARDLFAKGVTPAALRLEITRTHYRTNANFTLQGLADCQRMIDRWCKVDESLKQQIFKQGDQVAGARRSTHASTHAHDTATDAGPLERALQRFTEALCDDLNMARAIAALNEAISVESGSASPHRELAALHAMNSVLGVLERNQAVPSSSDADFEARVNALIEVRATARRTKDFASSDRARDQLSALGVQIQDSPTGTSWSRVVK